MNTIKSLAKHQEKLEPLKTSTSLERKYRPKGRRMPIIPLDSQPSYMITNTEKDSLSYYRFL